MSGLGQQRGGVRLNRIATAKTQALPPVVQYCWGETFSYDPWGNLLTIGAITPDYNGCTQENLEVDVTVKNQIDGSCYDTAGNLALNSPCPQPPGTPITPVYTYDAKNRMTATAGVTYTYDGDGRRVKKSTGKLYWYGASGLDALVETDLAGNTPTEFVFFGGKRIARRDPSGSVFYYFADHLGSSRVVTNATGTTVLDDSDFYPFGGERVVVNNDPNPYKFTGKERDPESGLDFFGARYYASTTGRFLSPDEFTGGPVDAFSASDPLPPGPLPYADITNPQSLNKYAYTLNNPLTYVDPNGHQEIDYKKLAAYMNAGAAVGTVVGALLGGAGGGAAGAGGGTLVAPGFGTVGGGIAGASAGATAGAAKGYGVGAAIGASLYFLFNFDKPRWWQPR